VVSAITDNAEPVHDRSDTSNTAPGPTNRLSGQIAHPGLDEQPVNKPVIPEAVQTESSTEARERHVQKSRTLYLNACYMYMWLRSVRGGNQRRRHRHAV
jgi:hypothetical protein